MTRPLQSRSSFLCAACCGICIACGPCLARAQGTEAVSPPEVVTRADALYPAEALRRGEEATVALLVTVELDGSVSAVAVEQAGGEAFDQAASNAVRQWTIRPATRDGQPVRVRIRVPFPFVLPPRDALVSGSVKI